jgi:hypothetical protein
MIRAKYFKDDGIIDFKKQSLPDVVISIITQHIGKGTRTKI